MAKSPETIELRQELNSAEIPIQPLGNAALQLSEAKGEDFQLKDRRIIRLTPIYSPDEIIENIPQSAASAETVKNSRKNIVNVLREKAEDKRLVVVVGPCSIHDPKSALEYADWLSDQRVKHRDNLEIVMRTYLEKPRTTVGWKGLINDPNLDGSFAINEGLVTARRLLHDITSKGVPVATELLDTSTPQYVADMISYGAIGARTTESQLHRELASGVSFPVGFKNGTGGSIQMAVDALHSAAAPHAFIGIDKEGHPSVVETTGNSDCHVILRGGSKGPNYDKNSVRQISQSLRDNKTPPALIIDTSHSNSGKDYTRQPEVVLDVAWQIAGGNHDIRGVMIESNLIEGSQKVPKNKKDLVYGQSITDGCSGLDDTEEMLEALAGAASARRAV